MQVISITSTKGGVGNTTITANLGAFIADSGLRVLLLDLDMQPTLSPYSGLRHRAPGGIYELLTFNERELACLVSRTAIDNLEVVLSDDEHWQLHTLLLHAPDRRLRLHNLLPAFQRYYDLMLLDTQGSRSVLLEMAVLASHQAVPPVTPEILAARELRRGTLQLVGDIGPYRNLGIAPPPLHLLINRVPVVSSNACLIQQTVRLIFKEQPGIQILGTESPAIEAFPRAATGSLPAHRLERRRRPTAKHHPPWRLYAAWPPSCIPNGVNDPQRSTARPAGGIPMSNAHELARGHKQLLPLIEHAQQEGWEVVRTAGGHLKFAKPGMPPIYTSSTASDHSAGRNTRALLRRTQIQFATTEPSPEKGGGHA